MSEAKHTRGDWQVMPEECDKPYIRIRGTVLGCRFKIANVLTPVYDNVHAREAEETRANAKLIAAAPNLLDALNAVMTDINDAAANGATSPLHIETRHKARSAIAAATGAQQ